MSTRAGTAEAGSDFTPLGPVALTFAPGETSKWVTIAIPAGDGPANDVDNETFYVDFTSTAGPATTITSTCTIQQLAIVDFRLLMGGLYAVRFPTAIGQRYVIEESDSPAGPWTDNSPILLGSGSPVTHVIFSPKPLSFFRVVAAPAPPGPSAVGP